MVRRRGDMPTRGIVRLASTTPDDAANAPGQSCHRRLPGYPPSRYGLRPGPVV